MQRWIILSQNIYHYNPIVVIVREYRHTKEKVGEG